MHCWLEKIHFVHIKYSHFLTMFAYNEEYSTMTLKVFASAYVMVYGNQSNIWTYTRNTYFKFTFYIFTLIY